MSHHFALTLALLTAAASARAADLYRFDFNNVPHAPGEEWTHVDATTRYDATAGYGFEETDYQPGKPFRFSARVPEGNYRVTLTLGGSGADASTTTVKAEQRRLMLERVAAPKGATVTRSFIVNVRTPDITGGRRVNIGDREIGSLDWDDKLTLEILGDHPTVGGVEIERVDNATTIFIAGDSTVCDQRAEPWTGWGQILPRFLAHDISVANYAESGRAFSSFRAERRLDKLLSVAKPGDYLFMQFGHNDMKEKFEGAGAFGNYATNIEQYVAAAREHGMTPVLITPMHRRRFDAAGHIENTFGDYPDAMRQEAKKLNVTLVDLNAMSKPFYEALGPDGSTKAFVHYPANTYPGQDKPLKDDTHHNAYGGYELAKCVVEGLRTSGLPLASRLAPDVVPFDPAKPDDVDAFALPTKPVEFDDKARGKLNGIGHASTLRTASDFRRSAGRAAVVVSPGPLYIRLSVVAVA